MVTAKGMFVEEYNAEFKKLILKCELVETEENTNTH